MDTDRGAAGTAHASPEGLPLSMIPCPTPARARRVHNGDARFHLATHTSAAVVPPIRIELAPDMIPQNA